MKQTIIEPSKTRLLRVGVGAALMCVLALSLTGLASADDAQKLGDATKTRLAGGITAPEPPGAFVAAEVASPADEAVAEMAARWGIEVTSIRLTANDHMIDFRYRVLDPEKAASLFVRQTKPQLVDEKSGKVLVVPDTAKIGPLRNSYQPQQGRIYWMFFGNAGNLVKAGDKVSVVIGEFRADDLVIE